MSEILAGEGTHHGWRKEVVTASLRAVSSKKRLVLAITGPGGVGKSTLLNALEGRYRAGGMAVHRGHSHRGTTGSDRRAVFIDDAHLLDEKALTEVCSLIGDKHVDIIVAYRPWPRSDGLRKLIKACKTESPPIVLGPLNPEEIHAHARAVLRSEISSDLVHRIAEFTGGMPWLVQRVLAGMRDDESLSTTDSLVTSHGMADLAEELDELEEQTRQVLLITAVGFTFAGRALPNLGLDEESLHRITTQLKAAGFTLPTGELIPMIRRALLDTTPAYQLEMLRKALVDTLSTDDGLPRDLIRGLAQEGFKDPRVALALEREADSVLETHPEIATELYEEAIAAGSPSRSMAARRAQAASAIGDLDTASRILDELLTDPLAPDLERAVNVSSLVWAQRGMLRRSTEIYRWLGRGNLGHSAPLAVVAMTGTGDAEEATQTLENFSLDASPQLLTVSTTLMAQGIQASVSHRSQDALAVLVKASDLMTASKARVPLPDYPAALGALVALHSGEMNAASAVIEAALAGDQGGVAARSRLLLLRAWIAMQEGNLELARRAIDEATTASHGRLTPRDEFLLHALEVGLARRFGEAPAIVAAWRSAQERISSVSIDLYSLLPLGELLIAAARLKESRWLDAHMNEAWTLLTKLDRPPVWSVPLHWSAVQVALLGERPEDIAPHAAALVRASASSPCAAAFAAAGRAWVSVLASRFDADTVMAAAHSLSAVGYAWNGSRLVGHAAARVEERKDMNRLLACARDLNPHSGTTTTSRDSTITPSSDQRTTSTEQHVLSAREKQVAVLVLEGKTYREVGETVFISTRTVEHHMARIRRRLGAKNRSELLMQLRTLLPEGDRSAKET